MLGIVVIINPISTILEINPIKRDENRQLAIFLSNRQRLRRLMKAVLKIKYFENVYFIIIIYCLFLLNFFKGTEPVLRKYKRD